MTPRTLLELGRVSNLPTVASNVACGAVLASAPLAPLPVALAAVAGSLFYVGGMVLNDAFDAEIDARERPERPIPSGRVARSAVFRLGFALLAAGLVVLLLLGVTGASPSGIRLTLAGAGTALCVVVYDRFHKGVALSPFVMGLCRAGLYLIGALAVSSELAPAVLLGAAALLAYVVGLTHIARFETGSSVEKGWVSLLLFAPIGTALVLPERTGHEITWMVWAFGILLAGWTVRGLALARAGGRNIGRAVVSLIAGIALSDAVLAAAVGGLAVAALSVGAWALTLGLQRWVRGT